MNYIQMISEWNDRVDAMRTTPPVFDRDEGQAILIEEMEEYVQAKKAADTEEMADALADQVVVCLGELRKMMKYGGGTMNDLLFFTSTMEDATVAMMMQFGADESEKIMIEVVSKLFTRFGDDCYINEYNKFKRSSVYEKPDLSFIKK